MMLCAGCRKSLRAVPSGGWAACCDSTYLSDAAPLPRDSWCPVQRVGWLYRYEFRGHVIQAAEAR